MRRMVTTLVMLLCVSTAHAGSTCSAPNKAIKEMIVLIDGGNSVGSGVIVSRRRILTAAHVIENTDTPLISINGELLPARLISLDTNNDLALLEADLPPVTPIQFSAHKLVKHDSVWAMGYPLGQRLIAASGRYKGTWSNAIYTSASVNYGQSGGGLIGCENNQHVLVGMVRAFGAVRKNGKLVRRDDISIATGLDDIRRFVSSANKVATLLH